MFDLAPIRVNPVQIAASRFNATPSFRLRSYSAMRAPLANWSRAPILRMPFAAARLLQMDESIAPVGRDTRLDNYFGVLSRKYSNEIFWSTGRLAPANKVARAQHEARQIIAAP
jgi:hypothetical protein